MSFTAQAILLGCLLAFADVNATHPDWPEKAKHGVEVELKGELMGLRLWEFNWAGTNGHVAELRKLLDTYGEWDFGLMMKHRFPTLVVQKLCNKPEAGKPNGVPKAEIIAVLSIYPLTAKAPKHLCASIYALAVEENYIRLGLAETLMSNPAWGPSWTLKHCPPLASTLELRVGEDNKPAISLYEEKLGFHCDRESRVAGSNASMYLTCTKDFKREGLVPRQWETTPKQLPYSLPISLREITGTLHGDLHLCGVAFDLLHADYPYHFPSSGKAAFLGRCTHGKVVVVITKNGEKVIAVAYADEENSLEGVSPEILALYFAQSKMYMAHGLQGWLSGQVLPEWIAHKQTEFKGKTHLGAFVNTADARATHSLIGKLGYSVAAVCDAYDRPQPLGEELTAKTVKLHNALEGLEDVCVGAATWGEMIETMFEENELFFVTRGISSQG